MTSQPILLLAERRRHTRVQLKMPVRLRWLAPLGQLTEVTVTVDVCRGGLLVHRSEPCRVKALLWVTFPFDSALPLTQPETPARVARADPAPDGGYLIGLQFGPAELDEAGFRAFDRRRHDRFPLALPIRVRPAGSLWPEDAMTIDISEGGVRFCCARLYAIGDTVHVSMPSGTLPRWGGSLTEVPARVVRLVPLPGYVEQQVALAFLLPENP